MAQFSRRAAILIFRVSELDMELFVIDRPRGDPQLADFSTSLGVGVGAARYGETYLAPLRPPKTRTESEQASRTRPLPPVALLPRAAIAQCSHGTRPWHSVWQPTAESGSIRVNGPGFAGPAARLLAALRAAPRAIAPRAMTSLNATTSSKGDSPFEEAAHRGGAGTAKPADIDEARYSL